MIEIDNMLVMFRTSNNSFGNVFVNLSFVSQTVFYSFQGETLNLNFVSAVFSDMAIHRDCQLFLNVRYLCSTGGIVYYFWCQVPVLCGVMSELLGNMGSARRFTYSNLHYNAP